MKRLIAIDLDRTVLNYGFRHDPTTEEARAKLNDFIKKCQKGPFIALLATFLKDEKTYRDEILKKSLKDLDE